MSKPLTTLAAILGGGQSRAVSPPIKRVRLQAAQLIWLRDDLSPESRVIERETE
jgi:hypothetical protein